MDDSRLPGALQALFDAGVRRYEVTGGGEPTLHPQIASILRAVRLLGQQVQLKLYTNATNLPSGQGIDETNISRCALEPERNARIMRYRDGSSPSVEQSIEQARQLGHRRVRLSVPVMRGGVEGLEDARRFVRATRRHVNGIVFRPLYDATPNLQALTVAVRRDEWQSVLSTEALDCCEVEVDMASCTQKSALILSSDLSLYDDWGLRNRVADAL
jgi:molybdenum cofactor biosynthesis enzyme MoaA